ncbi:hypothetical protein [Gimesia sp.]|uniref:hypothetical protein n=1 Tax=Gimesia sp. TaxID=2024833 RepID=UPI0032EB7AB3
MVSTTEKKGISRFINLYGNIDVRNGIPRGYCHVRRIDGISLHHWLTKLNIDYAKAMTGFCNSRFGCKPEFDGVVIATGAKPKLFAAIQERQRQKEAARIKEKRQEQIRIEQFRAARVAELASQYPKLDRQIILQFVIDGTNIIASDELGYQFGNGTKNYWSNLGFRTAGNPWGCHINGKRIYSIYNCRSLRAKKTKLTVKQLNKAWLKKYKTEELLLANALKLVNRLQKVNRIDEVYSLKDQWIEANQHNLTEGKFVRRETKVCWSCDGGYDDCWSCGGTGIYSDRTLYEHNFNIAGQDICFHSYVKPEILSDGKGADLRNYGRPFKRSDLPLPPQHLIVELIKELMA